MAERELAIVIRARDLASKSIRGVKKELGGLDKSMGRVGKAGSAAFGNMEKGIAIGAGAAVAGIGYAVKAAVDFEDAFAGVRKTVNETDLSKAGLTFENLSDDIRKMAREMPISAEEIARLAEAAGALGIKAGDISEFTRVAALLGTTTDVAAEDAANALGGLSASMGLLAKDYDNFGAALVGLGSAGSSTESAILGVTQRAGGLAKAAGFTSQQVLGWSSAVANLQMNEELAGSSIQRFIGTAIKAVGAGGKSLKVWAKTAGMTGDAFKKAFREDASGALQVLVNRLAKMPIEERTKALADMKLVGVGLTTMFSGLASNTDNLNDSLSNSDKLWKENTAMTKEAETRFKTTASAMSILKNNVHDAAITIGSALLPELAELSKQGTGWIQNNQGAIKQFAKDLAGGIREAVKWAKSLDWAAIGNALKAGAAGAKALVGAFLSLPPGIQAFLATGFVANKFTGGFLGDVMKDIGSGLIKGVLGMNAGVVNLNAGVVNGAGGAGGAAAGAAKTGLGTASRLFLIGEAIGLIAAVNEVRNSVQDNITTQASGVRQQADVWLQQSPPLADLKNGLAAVDAGINQLQTDPIGMMLVGGPGLDELRRTREGILTNIARVTDNTVRTVAASERAESRMTAAQLATAAATRDVRAKVEAHRITTAATAGRIALNTASVRDRVEAARIAVASGASRMASAAAVAGVVARGGGLAAAAAIRNKDLSVSVRVPITNNISMRTFTNGTLTYGQYSHTTSTGRTQF